MNTWCMSFFRFMFCDNWSPAIHAGQAMRAFVQKIQSLRLHTSRRHPSRIFCVESFKYRRGELASTMIWKGVNVLIPVPNDLTIRQSFMCRPLLISTLFRYRDPQGNRNWFVLCQQHLASSSACLLLCCNDFIFNLTCVRSLSSTNTLRLALRFQWENTKPWQGFERSFKYGKERFLLRQAPMVSKLNFEIVNFQCRPELWSKLPLFDTMPACILMIYKPSPCGRHTLCMYNLNKLQLPTLRWC